MKKTDWAILAGTAAYSFLFYEQHAGINCLIFTILLIISMFIAFEEVRKDRGWYLIAFAALFSSVFVFTISSDLAFFALIVCWLLLSAQAVAGRRTLINNLLTATFSVVSSVVFFIKRVVNAVGTKKSEPNDKRGVKILIYIVSVGLMILFFSLYKKANPLFENYTRKINLDFISLKWLFFTTWGFLFLYGLLRHERIQQFDDWEKRQELPLAAGPVSVVHKYLAQGFTFLFILINLMLLVINVLDINFLYLGSGLPEGITHKQFVHKGVNNLILSILLGISIILYVFKGAMNFDSRHRLLKFLVYLWLIQNVMMVFSTALRNHMYIMDALLTYKRIGVYYWLGLAVSGLVTTFIKIRYVVPNWFLIRSNSIVAFVLLVGSSALDWDLLISRYNISHASQVASLDKKYLLSLSEGNIGLLYPMRNHVDFETDSIWHYEFERKYANRKELDEKLYYFLEKVHKDGDWRSFNLREEETHKWVRTNQYLVDTLDLSECHQVDLSCLAELKNLKGLYLPRWYPLNDSTIRFLTPRDSLKILGLHTIESEQLHLFKKLPQLKKLQIRSNEVVAESLKVQLRERYPDLSIQ